MTPGGKAGLASDTFPLTTEGASLGQRRRGEGWGGGVLLDRGEGILLDREGASVGQR